MIDVEEFRVRIRWYNHQVWVHTHMHTYTHTHTHTHLAKIPGKPELDLALERGSEAVQPPCSPNTSRAWAHP